MTLSDNTKEAKSLVDFFNKLGKKAPNVLKKTSRKVLNNHGRVLKIGANVASSSASRISQQVLSTLPELITFIILVKV